MKTKEAVKQTHTPGPWGLVFRGRNTFVESLAGEGGNIATITEGRPVAEQFANARLIAAAPDLLAALKGLEQAAYLPHNDRGPYVLAARAAIFKAETA